MVSIHVTLTVRNQTDIDRVRGLLAEHARLSRAEPGCLRFEAFQSNLDPHAFFLVEVDLISAGRPVVASTAVIRSLKARTGRGRYFVVVSRAWERSPELEYEAFPFDLPDPLPCISVPLRKGEDEVLLDLQYVFDRSYDNGPYDRGAVDYGQPPGVSLTGEEKAWVRERVASVFPESSEAAP